MKLSDNDKKLIDWRIKDLEQKNEDIHRELDSYYGYVSNLLKVRIKTAENERIKGLLKKTYHDYFCSGTDLNWGIESVLGFKERSQLNYEYILSIIKETDAIKVESYKTTNNRLVADFYPLWSSLDYCTMKCPACGKLIHKNCYKCTCGKEFPEPETKYSLIEDNGDYIVRKCRGGYDYEDEWIEIVKDGKVFFARQGYVVDDSVYDDEFDDYVDEDKTTVDLDKEELE